MDRKSGMRREGRMPVAARRRPACMDAGGRAVSGTKAEESSDLIMPVFEALINPGGIQS